MDRKEDKEATLRLEKLSEEEKIAFSLAEKRRKEFVENTIEPFKEFEKLILGTLTKLNEAIQEGT